MLSGEIAPASDDGGDEARVPGRGRRAPSTNGEVEEPRAKPVVRDKQAEQQLGSAEQLAD